MTRDGLFDDLGRFGRATALIEEDGQETTFADLVRKADTIGRAAGRRELAFVITDNSLEGLAAYIGLVRARVPHALLSASMNRSLFGALLSVYRPRFVFLPRTMADFVPGTKVLAVEHYLLIDTAAEDCPTHPELALLTTTSGTTGSPKFVRQTYGNLTANTRSICEYLDIRSTDRAITSLPMNYVFGLSIINTHLVNGASLVVTNRGLMEKAFWDLVKSYRVTTLSGVPYTYQMLKQLRFGRMKLPDLKVMTQAGGKLPADLAAEFAGICHEKKIRFFIMYGAAEATARMSYLPPEYALEKSGSIGVAIPGGSFSLSDERGEPIPGPDSAGELVYRGPNVTMGYATRREDLAREDDNNGVLHTGDIARRDADGFYYIVGRKSRFLKVFGNRLSLEDLEHHLRKLEIECVCAGVDDKLSLYVTSEAAAAAASAAITEITGLHHSAFSVRIINRIPRNEAGKVLYSELPGEA